MEYLPSGRHIEEADYSVFIVVLLIQGYAYLLLVMHARVRQQVTVIPDEPVAFKFEAGIAPYYVGDKRLLPRHGFDHRYGFVIGFAAVFRDEACLIVRFPDRVLNGDAGS